MLSLQCTILLCRVVCLTLFIILTCNIVFAQANSIAGKDTLPAITKTTSQKDSVVRLIHSTLSSAKKIFYLKKQVPKDSTSQTANKNSISKDSAQRLYDSADARAKQAYLERKEEVLKKYSIANIFHIDSARNANLKRSLSSDSLGKRSNSFSNTLVIPSKKPSSWISFHGGFVSYALNYRSDLDTPFVERNLLQQQIASSLRLTIADRLPFSVNAYVRRTNSSLFPSVTDLQVAFDAPAYRTQVAQNMRSDLIARERSMQDSLTKQMFNLKQFQITNLKNWLSSAGNLQKLINAQEIIHVPKKTYDLTLPDSVNKKHSDSLIRLAKIFIDLYSKTTGELNTVTTERDSLKKIYDRTLMSYKKYESAINGPVPNLSSYAQWKKGSNDGSVSSSVPEKDKWLLGVKNFGVGKNIVNYSDLTVRNINLTGINFEYNSWYYLAAAAGKIDYRYTDFLVNPSQKVHQSLYVGRIGLGRLEKDYFILTAFRGQKQLFASTVTGTQLSVIPINGFSAQMKWQIVPGTYFLGEIAQSFSPNFLSAPPVKNSWSLSDKTSKAWSTKFYSYFPKTFTKFEAQYKFTGANYQSFTNFQTNAQYNSWYVKAEQSLFKRKLHLLASLRTNDYSNPYIIQDYKANSVFKTISASFVQKGFPFISAAYMPMSQLTVVGNQVVQNQFQTFNSSITHFYTIGQQRVATNLVFTKFYNSSSDTGFIYYNSSNLVLGHSLFFDHITGNITISYSENSFYRYTVMDENFIFQVAKRGSIGGGVKINNLNQLETKLGEYMNATMRINKADVIYLRIENGYLPGSGNKLIKNTMGSISFTKTFR
jgi:hypothetical protein